MAVGEALDPEPRVEMQALAQTVGSTLESLRSLHWGAHGLVGLALLSGLVLWVMGRRVLKPVVTILFAALGGAVGLVVITFTGLADSVGVLGGIGGGMVAGAILGLLVFRVAIAVGFALVLGLIAPIAASVIVGTASPDGEGGLKPEDQLLKGVDAERERAHDTMAKVKESAGHAAEAETPEARAEAAKQAAREAAESVKEFLGAVKDEASLRWDELPARQRTVIGMAAVGGVLLGFLMGLALPSWGAAAVTAMVGAAVWIMAGTWLMRAMEVPGQEALADLSARGWLIAWGAASVVGMAVQGRGAIRRGRSGEAEGEGAVG